MYRSECRKTRGVMSIQKIVELQMVISHQPWKQRWVVSVTMPRNFQLKYTALDKLMGALLTGEVVAVARKVHQRDGRVELTEAIAW